MSEESVYPTGFVGRAVEVTAAHYAKKYQGVLLSIDTHWVVLRTEREEIMTFPTANVEYVKSLTKS